MNPMVPGFQKPSGDGDTKMSSSSNEKIDLLDTAKNVKKK